MTASGHRMSVFEVMETHGWLIMAVLGASYIGCIRRACRDFAMLGKIHVCSTVAAFFSLVFYPFFLQPRSKERQPVMCISTMAFRRE